MRAKGIPACAALALFTQLAHAGGCDPIAAAQIKGLDLPARTRTDFTINGTFLGSLNSIDSHRKRYTHQKDGTWKIETLPLTPEKIQKNWTDEECSLTGADVVQGEAVDIYSNHEGGSAQSDSRFWISKSSGLILKTEITVLGKGNVVVMEHDYRDVPTADLPPG
jgi:hypothetical protein